MYWWILAHGLTAQPDTPASAQTAAAAATKPVIDADGAYHTGNGVTAPKLVYSVDAEFSDVARHRKIQGTTTIALTVMPDGSVAHLRIQQSAAEDFTKPKDRKAASTLDDKALDALRQYRFEPGMYLGNAVPVAITVKVNFHTYPSK